MSKLMSLACIVSRFRCGILVFRFVAELTSIAPSFRTRSSTLTLGRGGMTTGVGPWSFATASPRRSFPRLLGGVHQSRTSAFAFWLNGAAAARGGGGTYARMERCCCQAGAFGSSRCCP